jgi:hypothetical protein
VGAFDVSLDCGKLVFRDGVRRIGSTYLGGAGVYIHAENQCLVGNSILSLAFLLFYFVYRRRANINMIRYVYAPRIDIKPGIVKIKTGLKTPPRPPVACEFYCTDAGVASGGH